MFEISEEQFDEYEKQADDVFVAIGQLLVQHVIDNDLADIERTVRDRIGSGSVLTAAADDVSIPDIPPNLSLVQLLDFLLVNVAAPAFEQVVQNVVTRVVLSAPERFRVSFAGLDPDKVGRIVASRLAGARSLPAVVTDEVQRAVEKALLANVDPGRMAKVVQDEANIGTRKRASKIARTEGNSVASEGARSTAEAFQATALQPGETLWKVWNAAVSSPRTRDHHVEMNEQRVLFDDLFTAPDGSTGLVPGAESFSGRQRIHCRCFATYLVKDADGNFN